MAGSGVNRAVTKDGGTYNKLQRPGDFFDQGGVAPPQMPQPIEDSTITTTNKRKHTYQQDPSHAKRKRVGAEAWKENVQRSSIATFPTSMEADNGMRTVLPATNDKEDPRGGTADEEAMAYLRSVRSEASTIPHLLQAEVDSTTHEHEVDDAHQVLYHEGAWIAVEDASDSYNEDDLEAEDNDLDPQDRLYELLLKRFYALRTTLSGPLVSSVKSKMKRTDTLGGALAWIDIVRYEYPHISNVQWMEDDHIFKTIVTCTCAIDELGSDAIPPQLSCWIWTLLAAIRDCETLDHEQIGMIRDLAKQTALMRERMRQTVVRKLPADIAAAQRQKQSFTEAKIAEWLQDSPKKDDVVEDEIQGGSDSDADMSMSEDGEVIEQDKGSSALEEARVRLLAQLGDRLVQSQPKSSLAKTHKSDEDQELASVDANTAATVENHTSSDDQEFGSEDVNTRATIDMVLTVVAVCFGQRDLLSYMERW